MTSMLATHRIKLTLLLVAANTDLLLHLLAGEIKPIAAWDWLDIAGEGGSAVLLLTWLDLLLKSRSAGYVTNLLFMGLACLFSASSWAVLRNLLRYQTPLRGTAGLSRGPCRSISC